MLYGIICPFGVSISLLRMINCELSLIQVKRTMKLTRIFVGVMTNENDSGYYDAGLQVYVVLMADTEIITISGTDNMWPSSMLYKERLKLVSLFSS